MKILYAPFSRRLRNGNKNAKNYPWDQELHDALKELGHEIIQVGCPGEAQIADLFLSGLTFQEITKHIKECDTFISVDSYLQHHAWWMDKRGIVLWGQSDPSIFGHDLHINLYTDRKFFRQNQFDIWEGVPMIEEAFVRPSVVLLSLSTLN